ncbi:hypothetical protein [Amycolatopsis sp. NPDC051371]|uniref:hypothetical protein n=1 Tax=Amycolatopsis sp. NPDC051371 TaxID=3155800 RepID=UPI00342C2FCB
MSTLSTTQDSSAAGDLAVGEYWIELVPAVRGEPHQVSFPAVIEPYRHHGLWVRPRLRREVAEAMCRWLNLVYPVDPDWYPLARLEGDLLVVFTGDAAHHRHEIGPDIDGRYPLGELGRWFLSGPPRTPDRDADWPAAPRALRYRRDPGEALVTCDPGTPARSAFPARIETREGTAGRVAMFRLEIAEAVADYCIRANQEFPDDYPLAYFDGDTLVHVHQHRRTCDGYLPWRIEAMPDGTYRIDGDEWSFRPVHRKSEGMPHAFR